MLRVLPSHVSFTGSEFTSGFMDCLRHAGGGKRVLANKIYQEYIKDRDHVHMNSTHWTSLAGFVRFLGKTGVVIFLLIC
jgi:DNA/RNA-binding protein KIN17